MLTLNDKEVETLANTKVSITNSEYGDMLLIRDYCKVLKEICDPEYHDALRKLCNVALMKMKVDKS